MRIIRFASLHARPWKNGGGTTTELLAEPDGAGFEDFGWRLSVAEVASDGPFSRFGGIDRTLTVIAGRGMRLGIEGQDEALLGAGDAPLAFPGDVAVTATLTAGPIRDFNVMSRRGIWRHRVVPVAAGDGPGEAAQTLWFATDDLVLATAQGEVRLAFGDLAVGEDVTEVKAGQGLRVDLWPTG